MLVPHLLKIYLGLRWPSSVLEIVSSQRLKTNREITKTVLMNLINRGNNVKSVRNVKLLKLNLMLQITFTKSLKYCMWLKVWLPLVWYNLLVIFAFYNLQLLGLNGWKKKYIVTHGTGQLVNSFKCLFPLVDMLFDTKETKYLFYMTVVLYGKIDFTVKYIRVKYFRKEIDCKKSLISNTVCGRRHSKLFTNCHVSWDTLYLNKLQCWESGSIGSATFWLNLMKGAKY